MQSLIVFFTSATTWEAIGFICALGLLCNRRLYTWISAWLNKKNAKIQDDIQAATKLEEDATHLLQQYREQMLTQQEQITALKQQNAQEMAEVKSDIAQKTHSAVQRQKEATDIHIRLVAEQHQKKLVKGILDRFVQNTTQHFKKHKTENMNATIAHLFNNLEKDPEIFKQL